MAWNRGRKATKGTVYLLHAGKCFPSVKRCQYTEKHIDFIKGKGRDADLRNQTDILHIPYQRHETISTSDLLRGDFSYISHANIPEKAGLRKRQEKTHHILGSLRPTLLAFTKYSRESCPVASHANHSLPLPRQIPEPQRNAAHTFYFSSPQYTAGLTAETLVICHYNFCIYLQKTN